MPRDTQQVSLRVKTKFEKHFTSHKALLRGFPAFGIPPKKFCFVFFPLFHRGEGSNFLLLLTKFTERKTKSILFISEKTRRFSMYTKARI